MGLGRAESFFLADVHRYGCHELVLGGVRCKYKWMYTLM
jgi:hypothetical protein